MIVWKIDKKELTGKSCELPDGVNPKTYDSPTYLYRATHAEALEVLENLIDTRLRELSNEQERLKELYSGIYAARRKDSEVVVAEERGVKIL